MRLRADYIIYEYTTLSLIIWLSTVKLTVLDTFSQVFFNRYTEVFESAAQTCKTPLKLCRQRAISATAAHFSIAATRPKLEKKTVVNTIEYYLHSGVFQGLYLGLDIFF